MTDVPIQIQRTGEADPAVPLPAYATAGAAGADIRANFATAERVQGITLAPGAQALVPTGIRVAIPEGYEIQIRPRSGLAHKQGITLTNAPGTIDSDYRGPVGVLMINLGQEPHIIGHGDRIAQMVVAPVERGRFILADTLDETARGSGGFGSTGHH